MNARGRIGVVIPAVQDELDSDLLHGIDVQARALGYDVLVFTNASNSLKEYPRTDYVKGEENIYRLAECAQLDGILFAAGRFRNDQLTEALLHRLCKLQIPCIALEYQQEQMPYLYPPQREGMRCVTEHLINEHGCRTLYCLTGYEGKYEAEERLQGFLEAVAAAGIPKEQYRCIYGDFWKERAAQLAQEIADGQLAFPDAVVCANDSMAVALCEALRNHHIHVPEQIRVTGYDGSMSALLNDPSVTTVCGKEAVLGQNAVIQLHNMIYPERIAETVSTEMRLHYGTSCGCTETSAAKAERSHKTAFVERDFLYNVTYREYYMTSDMIGSMADAESLADFSRRADALAHLLPHWNRLDLCLCEDWLGDFEQPQCYRKADYPDHMLLLLSKGREGNARDGYRFATRQLLPALQADHIPEFVVLTPLHFQDQVFGYCALSYGEAKQFIMEERYHNWCDAAANGLRSLKSKLYIDYMQKKMEQYSLRDPLSGLYNRKGFLQTFPVMFDMRNHAQKVLLMVIGWKHTIITAGRDPNQGGLLIANAMQMLCRTDMLAARIGEKRFVICQWIPASENEREIADKTLLRLVKLLEHIQEQTSSQQMPELIMHITLPEQTHDPEAALHLAEEALNEKMKIAEDGKTDYVAQLRRFRLEIRMSPQFEWSADEAAAELGISKSYFQRLYKQQFGITFTDDLIAAKLDKAKELLTSTNLRIQEIAEACGYENTSHFMRQFKLKIGVTAMQWRNHCG